MERVLSRRGVLAAFVAMFALAFSLCFGATPAQADDDLAAGDADLTAQSSPGDPDYIETKGVSYAGATKDTDVVLSLYMQAGAEGEKTLVKQYTKADIDALAKEQTTDPIAIVADAKGLKQVYVSTKYVLLEGLLKDAGISKLWREGSSIDVENKKYGTYAYENFAEAYFYPKTTANDYDDEGAEQVPAMAFAISSANMPIDDDKTAQDMVGALSQDSEQSTEDALRVYVGISKEGLEAGGNEVAGMRLWSNIVDVTVIYDPDSTDSMFRLYNPNSGEHFYTASKTEHDGLVKLGWKDEGEGWVAPIMSTAPVYRLYNPNAGEHHYTTSEKERDGLVEKGWNDEGIGWYSDTNQGTVLYREYNPNAYACNHNYTTSKKEHDWLIGQGWQDEGTAWYGVAKDQ